MSTFEFKVNKAFSGMKRSADQPNLAAESPEHIHRRGESVSTSFISALHALMILCKT